MLRIKATMTGIQWSTTVVGCPECGHSNARYPDGLCSDKVVFVTGLVPEEGEPTDDLDIQAIDAATEEEGYTIDDVADITYEFCP